MWLACLDLVHRGVVTAQSYHFLNSIATIEDWLLLVQTSVRKEDAGAGTNQMRHCRSRKSDPAPSTIAFQSILHILTFTSWVALPRLFAL